jgi:hypothetical protein
VVCLRSGLRPSLRHTTPNVPQLSHEHWYRNWGGLSYTWRLGCRTVVYGLFEEAAKVVIEIVFLVDEASEGGFTARAVGESIFTEADSIDELRVNVRSAVDCHFEDGQGPKVIRLHIVRDEILVP